MKRLLILAGLALPLTASGQTCEEIGQAADAGRLALVQWAEEIEKRHRLRDRYAEDYAAGKIDEATYRAFLDKMKREMDEDRAQLEITRIVEAALFFTADAKGC